MGKLNIVIDEDLDSRFRLAVFKSKGMKKGNLTEAIEEAMELWIESQRTKRKELTKRQVQTSTT